MPPENKAKANSEWKWRYSMWTGIMYGPIPVGIIVAAICLIGYVVYTLAMG